VFECEQLNADAYCHGGTLHRVSAFHVFCSEWPYAVFLSVPQYTSDVTVVPCCMNSTILSQLSGRRFFKLFRLVWWMYFASTALTAPCSQNSQMKPRFHRLLVLRCDWEIHRHLCGIAVKKVKAESHSLCFVRTREHFRNSSYSQLVIAYPKCDNIVENSAWNLRKFTRKFWNCEAPSFALNKITTRYKWPTTSLFIMNIYPSLYILHHCLSFPLLLTFWP
jgi:hypothetical protein